MMFGLTDQATATIITGLFTGLLGGLSVAVFNYLFGRKKMQYEIEQIKANTEKTIIETEKIKRSIQDVSEKISQTEDVIYDGSKKIDGFDFIGQGERFYGEDESKPEGSGRLTISDNTIQIIRFNTGG